MPDYDRVVVSLSGADVLDIDVECQDGRSVIVEVRQYHADFQNGEADFDSDERGRYEVVA